MPPFPKDIPAAASVVAATPTPAVLPKSQAQVPVDGGKKKKPIQPKGKTAPQKQELSDEEQLVNLQKFVTGKPEISTTGATWVNQMVRDLKESGFNKPDEEYRDYNKFQWKSAPAPLNEIADSEMNKIVEEISKEKPNLGGWRGEDPTKVYRYRGNYSEHMARLASEGIKNALRLGIKNEQDFMQSVDAIFPKKMFGEYEKSEGWYRNLIPTVARLYGKKIKNFTPVTKEEAQAVLARQKSGGNENASPIQQQIESKYQQTNILPKSSQ